MYEPLQRPNLLEASLVADSPFLFLRLRGELDVCSVEEIPGDTYRLRRDLTTVLVDLGGLRFCDSTGIAGLLSFRGIHAAQGRSVTVVRADPRIWRMMRLCGITDRLEVAPKTLARVIPLRPSATGTAPAST